MNENKRKVSFSANGKQSIIIFILALALLVGLTFLMWPIRMITSYYAKLCINLLLIVAYSVVAVVAMILTGQGKELIPTKNKLWLQLLLALGISGILCFFIGILPILCGTSLVGAHSEASTEKIILSAVLNILFVGVGEEIFFRGYVQNQITIWLKKCKWLAPLFAAVLFGFWHLVNGSIIQVLFATMIGCVFGYAKYFIKDCSLLSVALAHGLYDFSLVLLTCYML